MRRILMGSFCIAVGLVVGLIVGFSSAQESRPHYQPTPHAQHPDLLLRGHRDVPLSASYAQPVLAPQSPTPVGAQRPATATSPHQVIELLRAAAKLLDAAGERDDADRLRRKAKALDERHQLQEKQTELERLKQEIEQLKRQIDDRQVRSNAHEKETATRRSPDVGRQQVLVQAKVMELSLTKLRDAGFEFDGIDADALANSGFGAVISSLSESASDSTALTSAPIKQVTPSGGQQIAYDVLDEKTRVDALIDALAKTGALRILAEPDLMTVSGQPASFNVGGEFPIPTPDGIVLKKFGTQLDISPLVLDDKRMRLEIRSRVSELDKARTVEIYGQDVPGLRVREVNTGFEARSGQTLVLAGLVQERTPSDEAHARTGASGSRAGTSEAVHETTEIETEDVVASEDGHVQATVKTWATLAATAAADSEAIECDGDKQTERVELIVMVTPHLIDPANLPRWVERMQPKEPVIGVAGPE